jgi:predicted Zn-dependent protease
MADMTLLVVVPQHLANENQIGVAVTTLATTLKLECGLDVSTKIIPIAKADGKVYDPQFRIVRNTVKPEQIIALADAVAGTQPRKVYVLFLCQEIVYEQNQQFVPSGVNGFSVQDRAVSCIAVQQLKSTIGDADGQTWTHEIGHGLGLDHVAQTEEENLMHPSRHGAQGTLTGFKLTESQKWAMIRGCEKLSKEGAAAK